MEDLIILPGLPQELGLDCLARLHYKSRPVASQACRGWLNLLQSRQFYSLRKQLGYTNQIACLLQSLPTHTGTAAEEAPKNPSLVGLGPACCVITVFDPTSHEWGRLPPVPKYTNGLPLFCQITSSEGKLVLMGGWDPVSYETLGSVFVYDFNTCRWRQGKDMPSRRSFFAIGAMGCRVFIAGGHDTDKKALDSAWAYDVMRDEWAELTRMSQERDECEGIVIGDEFWVISGYKTEFQGGFEGSVESYNLGTGEWRRLETGWKQGEWPRSCARLGKDGRFTSWTELNSDVSGMACGVVLGEKSLVMGSAHQGATLGFFMVVGQDEKLERIDVPYEFSGFVQSSCCVDV